jgi:hypothetical protein
MSQQSLSRTVTRTFSDVILKGQTRFVLELGKQIRVIMLLRPATGKHQLKSEKTSQDPGRPQAELTTEWSRHFLSNEICTYKGTLSKPLPHN